MICRHFQRSKTNVVSDGGLALSLEWSTRLNPNPTDPRIVVSDSKGGVSVFAVSADARSAQLEFRCGDAHSFECWIAAFDARDDRIVFSGGDDSVMKCLDTRTSTAAFVNGREHGAGVTSLQSDVRKEHVLYSGR